MVIYGLLMAMDTLVSQAKGAGNLELCGVYLNRSRFILTIFYIPMVLISYYVEEILIALG
jgi:Na+-driven multidrug efflux pump